MRHLISALLFVSILGCSVSNVSSGYDKGVNFNSLRTYDFSDVSRPLRGDTVFVDSFKRAAEANLRLKGFTRSTGSPDFVISLHRSTELRRDYNSRGNYPYGIDARYRRTYQPYMEEYTQEILYVTFFRPGTKNSIWHGARAGRYVPGLTPADNQVKAKKAATEILKGFPPRAK